MKPQISLALQEKFMFGTRKLLHRIKTAPEQISPPISQEGSIWSSYINLPPLQRLAVTLSFTFTGMFGLYIVGDDPMPVSGDPKQKEGFFAWTLRMAKQDWETAQKRSVNARPPISIPQNTEKHDR
jgi:hypothetical protein